MLGDSWYFLTPYSLPLITLPNVCIKLCSFASHANQLNPLSPCCCCCLLETGGKGARHNLGKHDIAQGHNIDWLESNGSKMTDKPPSTWPWLSAYAHCNRSASEVIHPEVPWQFQDWPSKIRKSAVTQFLEISPSSWKCLEKSSYSLAYEITQPVKANSTASRGCTGLLQCPTLLCGVYVSLSKPTFLPNTLSLIEFFLQWDIKNLRFIRS